jgi:hypothetical protein
MINIKRNPKKEKIYQSIVRYLINIFIYIVSKCEVSRENVINLGKLQKIYCKEVIKESLFTSLFLEKL